MSAPNSTPDMTTQDVIDQLAASEALGGGSMEQWKYLHAPGRARARAVHSARHCVAYEFADALNGVHPDDYELLVERAAWSTTKTRRLAAAIRRRDKARQAPQP